MVDVYKKDTMVSLSHYDYDGWWTCNESRLILKGTSLPVNSTTIIYQPSDSAMTAKFENGAWVEIVDKRKIPFYTPDGRIQQHSQPDSELPDGCTEIEPPELEEGEICKFENDKWSIFKDKVGEKYYDVWGDEHVVEDPYFELPDKHTYTKPPIVDDGKALQLEDDGTWSMVVDNRGKYAYSIDGDESKNYYIHDLTPIPETHTLLEPPERSVWDKDNNCWVLDPVQDKEHQSGLEREWRDKKLTEILNRLNQHQFNLSIPEEHRTMVLSDDDYGKLLSDRKVLSNYPQTKSFPYGDRPILNYDSIFIDG